MPPRKSSAWQKRPRRRCKKTPSELSTADLQANYEPPAVQQKDSALDEWNSTQDEQSLAQSPGNSERKPEDEDRNIVTLEELQGATIKFEPEEDAAADLKNGITDIIEIGAEIKQEFTPSAVLIHVSPVSEEQPKELVEIDLTDKAATEGVKPCSSRFSKKRTIKTKDRALKYIKRLEDFALEKENFRLIGLTERLQQYIKEGS